MKVYGLLDLVVKSGIDLPVYVVVAFQNRNKIDSAAQDNSVFLRPNVPSAHDFNGKERCFETRKVTVYGKHNVSQVSLQLVSCFWLLSNENS